MKKNQKNKQKQHQKEQNEALEFLTKFGAKQKFGEVTEEIEARLDEEIHVFRNLGVAEDLITLKNILDKLKTELGYTAEPSNGILAGSYVAFSLGLEPSNPLETSNELNPLDLKLPLNLTISFDNEVRNQVAEWMKTNGYEVSTYLGQPLLKLKQTRVLIRRVVKQ